MRDIGSERRRIFVTEVPQVTPVRQRAINLPGPAIKVAGDSRIAAIDRVSRRLVLLNGELEPAQDVLLSGLPDPAPGARFERLVVLPDLTVIVLSLDHVTCVDPSGGQRWRLAHAPWPRGVVGGDAIVLDHRVAIVVPQGAAPAGHAQVPAAELAVVNIENGLENVRLPLPDDIGDPEGFHAFTRRGQSGGAIDGGYGQDGSQIWRLTLSSGRAEATPLGTSDRILADISPAGDELLTTPHGGGGLVLYRWEDLTEAGRLEPADVFELEAGNDDLRADSFDYYAWFLSSDRLLALTRQGRLLLFDRRRMTVESQIIPSGFDIVGYDERGHPVEDPGQAVDFAGEISAVTVIDENRILVHGQGRRVELCQL